MRGGGINATTSHQTKDYRSSGKSNGEGDGDGECRAPPLRATALVLAAEAAAKLIADDAAHLSRQGVGQLINSFLYLLLA
jgi:hypothetical protein